MCIGVECSSIRHAHDKICDWIILLFILKHSLLSGLIKINLYVFSKVIVVQVFHSFGSLLLGSVSHLSDTSADSLVANKLFLDRTRQHLSVLGANLIKLIFCDLFFDVLQEQNSVVFIINHILHHQLLLNNIFGISCWHHVSLLICMVVPICIIIVLNSKLVASIDLVSVKFLDCFGCLFFGLILDESYACEA